MKQWFVKFVLCAALAAIPALFWSAAASAQGIPTPVRVAGTLTVDGALVPGTAGDRYRIEIVKAGGESYDPAAVDDDGLNENGVYVVDIPVFDAATQDGGAQLGETAVLRVTEDGAPLIVTSPEDGELTVERPTTGTSLTIDIVAERETQANVRPVASATGPDTPVAPGDQVDLDGSGSYDPDPGDILSYLWEQLTDADLSISGADQAQARFTVPETISQDNNPLTFRLTVTDGGGLSDTAQVSVTVTSETNQPPVADAGEPQTVRAGETVQLDGSGSVDPDGQIATYQWVQIDDGGPMVSLVNADTNAPSFIAPTPTGGSVALRFELTVADDDGASDADTVTITVSPAANVAPIAVAGASETVVEEGVTVTLDAAGSSDPDGFIDSYRWRQTGDGPDAVLSNPQAAAPTFVTPSVPVGGALITFELTVTDNEGLTDADAVDITVRDNGIDIFPEEAIAFRTSTDSAMGIEMNEGEIVDLDPAPAVSASGAPAGRVYGDVGVAFVLHAPGADADFVMHLPDAPPEGYRWYRYRAGDGWRAIEEGVTDLGTRARSAEASGGTRFRMVLEDGGDVDGDRAVNGRFSAILSIGAEEGDAPDADDEDDHGNSGETNNCFIAGAGAGGWQDFWRAFCAVLAAAAAFGLAGKICRRRSMGR